MINRETYIQSIRYEAELLKHLYTKVPQDKLDYRPSPEQRSMRELLAYLPCNFAVIGRRVIENNFQDVRADMEPVKAAALEDFPSTVEREAEKFVQLIEAVPEADFTNKQITLPVGLTQPLGMALFTFNSKFMAAYRMQLFLYLKACGRTELKSLNLWRGKDPEPK